MAYHNAEVDRLLEPGRVTRTQEARKPIYTEVLKILLDEQPWIPVAYPDYVFAAKPTLRGLTEGETVDAWYHLTGRAWEWTK
jgi:ABC-type transport system substrate-binding protein